MLSSFYSHLWDSNHTYASYRYDDNLSFAFSIVPPSYCFWAYTSLTLFICNLGCYILELQVTWAYGNCIFLLWKYSSDKQKWSDMIWNKMQTWDQGLTYNLHL